MTDGLAHYTRLLQANNLIFLFIVVRMQNQFALATCKYEVILHNAFINLPAQRKR